MMSILKYSLLIGLLINTGCSEKKSHLAPENGKYYIQSLGDNVNQKTLEQSIVVKSSDSNIKYRAGSLNGKLSDNIVVNRISGQSQEDINVFAVPSISGNDIITLTGSGKLIKSTILPNGKISKIWEKTIYSGFCSNISLGSNENIILATCGDNSIKGFNVENGSELWKLDIDSPIVSQPSFVGGSTIFFGKNDSVYSVNYISGELQWYLSNTINSSNRSLYPAAPLLVEKYIIQQSYDDQVRAINVENGQIEWLADISSGNVKGKEFLNYYGNIAYDMTESTLYLNNSSGEIVKLKIGSDNPQWIKPSIVSKPLWLLDNIILAVNDLGSIVALSKADGTTIWSNDILKKIIKKGEDKDFFGKQKPYNEISLTPPIVIDNQIILMTSNGKLIIVSPENGRILSVKNLNKNVFGSPFVHNNKIYVITRNGREIIQL